MPVTDDGKSMAALFNGGELSSDAVVLVLRKIEAPPRMSLIGWPAARMLPESGSGGEFFGPVETAGRLNASKLTSAGQGRRIRGRWGGSLHDKVRASDLSVSAIAIIGTGRSRLN